MGGIFAFAFLVIVVGAGLAYIALDTEENKEAAFTVSEESSESL